MLELYTILLAASPIVELRGAIPIAVGFFHFWWGKALLLSLIGNILPVFPLLWFWENLSQKISETSPLMNRFFHWLFSRTRRKFQGKWKRWGKAALTLFVALPLPFTGAWTGTIAAFLFGIEKREAFLLISGGVLIAGIIVTILTLGGIKLF